MKTKTALKYIEFARAAYDLNLKDIALGTSHICAKKQNQLTGFKGFSAFNVEDNELVIAFAGTHGDVSNDKNIAEFLKDLVSNVSYLSRKKIPQLQDALELTTTAMEMAVQLANDVSDIKITFVGHSLGGVLSELMTAELLSSGIEANAITFDTPGTKSYIKQHYPDVLDAIPTHVKGVIATPNLINFFKGTHVGEVYLAADSRAAVIKNRFSDFINKIGNNEKGSLKVAEDLFSNNMNTHSLDFIKAKLTEVKVANLPESVLSNGGIGGFFDRAVDSISENGLQGTFENIANVFNKPAKVTPTATPMPTATATPTAASYQANADNHETPAHTTSTEKVSFDGMLAAGALMVGAIVVATALISEPTCKHHADYCDDMLY